MGFTKDDAKRFNEAMKTYAGASDKSAPGFTGSTFQKMFKTHWAKEYKKHETAILNHKLLITKKDLANGKYLQWEKSFDFLKAIADIVGGGDDTACHLVDITKPMHLKAVVANADQVGRMTDASKYTGAHKERFDADGKGKGAEGRTDKADNSGYVGNYKGEGSYKK